MHFCYEPNLILNMNKSIRHFTGFSDRDVGTQIYNAHSYTGFTQDLVRDGPLLSALIKGHFIPIFNWEKKLIMFQTEYVAPPQSKLKGKTLLWYLVCSMKYFDTSIFYLKFLWIKFCWSYFLHTTSLLQNSSEQLLDWVPQVVICFQFAGQFVHPEKRQIVTSPISVQCSAKMNHRIAANRIQHLAAGESAHSCTICQ